MKIIVDERCVDYSHAGHPERPERISGVLQALREQKDWEIDWQKPSTISENVLLKAHSEEHLERLEKHEDFDMDTPYMPGIASHARTSAAAAVDAMRTAKPGEAVFSLMRPPGHHATRHRAMGFCYLSNVAIAALEALDPGRKSVAVYDFDVHHGNGTEAILVNKPGTYFLSVHQHPCYPGTGTRNVGNNCFNYPVPPQTERLEYRRILASALEQMKRINPDLVAVSAGFDTFARDPLAQQKLEVEDFYWLGKSLRDVGLPMFSVLEGGYSDELPSLVLAYLRGLEGK
jgi:acetoin utilization deacetylase AcuC-like enzyme